MHFPFFYKNDPLRCHDDFKNNLTKEIVSAGALLCACVGLSSGGNAIVAFAVIGVLSAYIAWMTRSPLVCCCILVTAALPLSLLGSFSLAAIILSIVVGIGAFAFLFGTGRWYLAMLAPVLAFGASFAIGKNIWFALLSLLTVPAGILMAYAVGKQKKRTSAICWGIGGLLLVLAAIGALLLWKETGTLADRSVLVSYLNGIKESIVTEITLLRDQMLDLLVSSGASSEDPAYQSLVQMLGDEMILAYVSQIISLIPGIAVILCAIFSYEAHLLLTSACAGTPYSAHFTKEMLTFTMSMAASLVYIIAFFVSIFSPANSLAYAAAQNLVLMLLPGFCVVGVQMILTLFARIGGRGKWFFAVFLISLICCYTGGFLYLIAFWASCGGIMAALKQKMNSILADQDNDRSN